MDFRLSDLGDGIASAMVVSVLVKAGDSVTSGQTLLEVETDKATMPITADFEGTVSQVSAKRGDKLVPGAVVLTYSAGKTAEGDSKVSAVPTPPAGTPTGGKESAPASQAPAPASQTASKLEFVVPNLGDGVEVATIVDIFIKVGDTVKSEQEAFGIETDKATMPVPSPFEGKVEEIRVKKGEKVRIGQILAVVTGQASAASAPAPAPSSALQPKAAPAPAPHGANENGSGVQGDPRLPVAAGPATRRYARELGVNLTEVRGSARGGRVTVDDVKSHVKTRMTQPAASTAPSGGGFTAPPLPDFSKYGPVEVKQATNLRLTIAKNLTVAWNTMPMVTQFDQADITDLEAGRKRITEGLPKGAPKITMTILAIKAVVAALKEFPNFNTSLDLGKGQLIQKNYYHVGIAVDTERGLVVPVIRDADKKSIRELAKDVTELAEKARNNKLSLDEMRGGTFTITNLGGVGGTAFSPIVNYPEVAILGMARSSLQPVVRGDKIEPRLILPLCLTYDHRVVDGADGARFTTRLVQLFSDPIRLLMES
jgi:pyruvate dehydrogenase E2 component (dihydrolipoamide acetyltransferase)